MALPRLKKMMGYADGTSDTSNPWAAALSRVTQATTNLGQGVYDALSATPAAQAASQRAAQVAPAWAQGDYGRAIGAGAAALTGAGIGAPLEAASSAYNTATEAPARAGGAFLRSLIGGYAGAPPAAAAPGVAPPPPSPTARPTYADWTAPAAPAAPAAVAPARGIHAAALGEVPPNNGPVDIVRAGVMTPGGGGAGLPLQLREMLLQAQINRAMQPAAVQAAHELMAQSQLAYAVSSTALLKKYGATATPDNPQYVQEQQALEAQHQKDLMRILAGPQYDMLQSLQAGQTQAYPPGLPYGMMPQQ